jgi:hypothetical protein
MPDETQKYAVVQSAPGDSSREPLVRQRARPWSAWHQKMGLVEGA